MQRTRVIFAFMLLMFLKNDLIFGDDERIIADGAKLKKLADGFQFTEGPAADSHGNVFFTDQPNNRILKWSVEGKLSTFLSPCGRSNGLCFDGKENLLACADEKNELWRIELDAKSGAYVKHTIVVNEFEGKKLNGPNDIWIRPNGGIYLSDPLYQRTYWPKESMQRAKEAVYFLKPNEKIMVLVADDLQKPNGIIGTPDGKTLYIADTSANKTYKYEIQADGSLANKTTFCSQGSDGMTIDEKGNVYLTGRGVTAFDKNGNKIKYISVPESWTSNVCFGGKDKQTLFITASKCLYGIRMNVKGAGSQ